MTTTLLAPFAALAFRESRRLAEDRNIRAVGCGIKLRERRPAGTLCIQYYVDRKLPRASLGGGTWPIPATVDGVPTDVIEIGHAAAAVSDASPPAGARGTRVADPLIGGFATTTYGAPGAGPGGGFGTLGGTCFDAETFAPRALSAAHVWGTTPGTEAIQPIFPPTVFSTSVEPAQNPGGLVRSDIAPALRATVAFASAGAWANLLTGLAGDPIVFGQGATVVPDDARTDTEVVSVVAAAGPGQPPAGRAFTASVSWGYQRLSTTAELEAAVTNNQTNDKVLLVQKASTDAPSYTGAAVVKLSAEIAIAGETLPSQFVVAHIYPQPAGDRVVRRLLRPVAGQAPPAAGRGFIYAGTVGTADLGKGSWAVSLFVQDVTTGITESANVGTTLLADATFTVS